MITAITKKQITQNRKNGKVKNKCSYNSHLSTKCIELKANLVQSFKIT